MSSTPKLKDDNSNLGSTSSIHGLQRRYEGSIVNVDGCRYLVTAESSDKPGHMMVRAMGSGRLLVPMSLDTIRLCIEP